VITDTVEKIENLISEVSELQRVYVDDLCSGCEDPCCKRVHYLFNEKDILFLKLSRRKQKWRRESLKKNGCWFLGPHGCILESKSRPFICHRYLCQKMESKIRSEEPEILSILNERFKSIDALRSRMWSEYLDDKMNG
jgi:hypothetical protein